DRAPRRGPVRAGRRGRRSDPGRAFAGVCGSPDGGGLRIGLIRGIAVGGVVGIVIGGCGGGAHVGTSAASNAPAAQHGPTAARTTPRPPSAEMQLQRSLSTVLRKAGSSSGAVVYDITAGKQLFSMRASIRRPPASVEKL